ncbi:hypothetical protein [Nocardia pseudobrasiliensis]|uniref:Uncharacterized protein n=1 Tax=Nocardia pseudobrasiliensis TaxID=45979 RepID=A0A370I9P9_9NOCA|nr:hypothetical protein [Nocardia pseudobrasiliensis]RDI67370.1 hypothetical protein DFR76_103441 [Nocardia pseudobrasiliensis]
MSADRYLVLRPGVHVAHVPGEGTFFGGSVGKFVLKTAVRADEVFLRYEPELVRGIAETELRAHCDRRGDDPDSVLSLIQVLVHRDLVRVLDPNGFDTFVGQSEWSARHPGISAEIDGRLSDPETAKARLANATAVVEIDEEHREPVAATLALCGISRDRIRFSDTASRDRITVTAGAAIGIGELDLTDWPAVILSGTGDPGGNRLALLRERLRCWRPELSDASRPAARSLAPRLAALAAVEELAGLTTGTAQFVCAEPLTVDRVRYPATGDGTGDTLSLAQYWQGDWSFGVRLVDGDRLPQLPVRTAAARSVRAAAAAVPDQVCWAAEHDAARVEAVLAAARVDLSVGTRPGEIACAGTSPELAVADGYLRAAPLTHWRPHQYSEVEAILARRMWVDLEQRLVDRVEVAIAPVGDTGWQASRTRSRGGEFTAFGRSVEEAVFCAVASAFVAALLADEPVGYIATPAVNTMALNALDAAELDRLTMTLHTTFPELARRTPRFAEPDPFHGHTPIHAAVLPIGAHDV